MNEHLRAVSSSSQALAWSGTVVASLTWVDEILPLVWQALNQHAAQCICC